MYLELNEERTNYMERFIDAFTAWSDEVDGWIYSNVLFWLLIVAGLFLQFVQNLCSLDCFGRNQSFDREEPRRRNFIF